MAKQDSIDEEQNDVNSLTHKIGTELYFKDPNRI